MRVRGGRVRIAIRVKPGSSRVRVGGLHGDRLVVAVNARPVDGEATEAALVALADALGARRRDVRLVAGVKGRDKLVEIEPEPAGCAERLRALRG